MFATASLQHTGLDLVRIFSRVIDGGLILMPQVAMLSPWHVLVRLAVHRG